MITSCESLESAARTAAVLRRIFPALFYSPVTANPVGGRGAGRTEERRAVENFFLEVLEIEINHRRDEQGDKLRDHQPADDD